MNDEDEKTVRVRDGFQILEFVGEEIGFSSSKNPSRDRWIEFTLYKTTEGGQYVLSRVGCSRIYHHPECEIAVRGRLDESPESDVDSDDKPCPECRPDRTGDFPFVSFEREKHWARVFKTPEAVIRGLMKSDSRTGQWYMTDVARRLLEDAAQTDDGIDQSYVVERIR